MKNKNTFKFMNISDSDILSNLSITLTNNVVGEKAFLWNKYQIYMIDLEDSENVAQELFFDFDILAQVLASHQYLICRDQSGIVWKAKMNVFEIKPYFIKLDENIISITQSENGKIFLSLKMVSNSCNLLVYNSYDLNLLNRYEIVNTDINYNETNYSKCKMYCHSYNEREKIFITTFNSLTLHYFFINFFEPSNSIVAKKLLNCPTEINDIHFINQNILISLSIGTIINIDLRTLKHKLKIIHLNTAIHKIVVVKDYLIYTDGQTMWRADNIFSKEEDISFRQIFVKLIKDFIYIEEQNEILCTTYLKKLYRFSLDDETAYIKSISTKEYCTAKQLLNDMSYMQQIVSEIEENDEITKKIKVEENLITILALANRQDIVNNIISFEMAVHENYEDIVQNYKLLTLTNDMKDYYILGSYYLIIKLTMSPVHPKFTDSLSDLFGKLEIHITLLSERKVLKTVTLKVIKQLKSMNIVVPLEHLKSTKIKVCIKLVTSIPGALDRKQMLWVTLHTSETVLGSEHFIKSILPSGNIYHLKKTPETINNLICENASKQYGNLFKFSKIKNKSNFMKWQLYVKLPEHYRELFENEKFYKYLNSSQKKLLMTVMSSDNLLKSGNSVSLNVANEKVDIDIDVGFSNPILRTASMNLQVASDIRDFISNLLYAEQNNTNEDFVSNSILEILKDLEKDLKGLQSADSPEKFLHLHDKFQKNVIISLNI